MEYKVEFKVKVPDELVPTDWAEKLDFEDQVREWVEFHIDGGMLKNTHPLAKTPFLVVNGSVWTKE